MRRIIGQSILAIGVFLMLNACGSSNRTFEKNHDFENPYWIFEQPAVFQFEIKDTTQAYNLYYNVRNSPHYPYQNLYIQHYLRDSADHLLQKALNNVQIFDDKTGKPLGDGLGDIFDHRFLAIKGLHFPYKGNYSIKLEQYMRVDTLPGIMAVGVRIEKGNGN